MNSLRKININCTEVYPRKHKQKFSFVVMSTVRVPSRLILKQVEEEEASQTCEWIKNSSERKFCVNKKVSWHWESAGRGEYFFSLFLAFISKLLFLFFHMHIKFFITKNFVFASFSFEEFSSFFMHNVGEIIYDSFLLSREKFLIMRFH